MDKSTYTSSSFTQIYNLLLYVCAVVVLEEEKSL